MIENYYLFFIPRFAGGKINVDTSDLKKKKVEFRFDASDFNPYIFASLFFSAEALRRFNNATCLSPCLPIMAR